MEVTFHPDYTYHDFIGSLKPTIKYRKNTGTKIFSNINNEKPDSTDFDPIVVYDFTPGPFLIVLLKALLHPEKRFALMIDEINRGNVPEIMGDLFQLLDRKASYRSSSNLEAIQYIANYIKDFSSFYIPENLLLYATLNSSDQNVYPLDTAFKRRWDWKHVGINYSEKTCGDWLIKFCNCNFLWADFIKVINNFLIHDLDLAEDKQIGQFFIFKDENEALNNDTEKLMKYFWDDIPKHKRSLFFEPGIKTYEGLTEANNHLLESMFSESLAVKLKEIALN